MTDPLSRGKIEDVILSIRRLVSETDAEEGQASATVDRLVLTPSLRIGEGAGGAAASGAPAPDIEETLDALEAEVSRKAGQWSRGEGEAGADAAGGEETVSVYDDWEPADPGTPRGTQSASDEVIDLEVAEAGAGTASRPGLPETDMAAADLDTLLDERELRALVAEVLREELKGPLGERITRNVRKLVRREIAQALAGLNLD